MSKFSRESLPKIISLRVSEEQDELLQAYAKQMGLRGKSDVLRLALDYWLEHAPEARGPRPPRKGQSGS